MKTEVEIVSYGGVSEVLTKHRWRTKRHDAHFSISSRKPATAGRLVVAFSHDLDDFFVELFREKATHETRLLILNEGASADRLLSRILDLQIRTPQRCYVLEAKHGAGKTHIRVALIHSLLERLVSGLEADDQQQRIFDARAENGILRVVSPNFERLDIPIAKVPVLKNADACTLQDFEIDEDGAFIYWPELDVHLGWSQLHQLVNPEAALKASQKNQEFNKRYGKAVQKVREIAGLKPGDVPGLSEKQLGRIERGQCRLTSNAIAALSKAHKLDPNEYMKKLAKALK